MASAAARLLAVPVADAILAVRDDEPGVLVPSFLGPGESLEHGNELLVGLDESYQPDRVGEVPGYTVQRVMKALDGFAPPTGGATWIQSAGETFAGYLTLDALIANQDRHHTNWGLVTSASGRRLAPAYDQAASLGHQATDKQRRLDEGQVGAWAARGRSNQFEGRPRLVEAAREARS